MQDSLLLLIKVILLWKFCMQVMFYAPSKDAKNLKAGHY